MLASLPIPLPRYYVMGLDVQQRDFEHFSTPSYLRGEFRDHGWWYYYLYAIAIKVPLGTWILFLALAVARCSGMISGPSKVDEFALLAVPLAVFVAASANTGINHHMRYILPCFPFMYIWTSQVAILGSRVQAGLCADEYLSNRTRALFLAAVLACLGAIWSFSSSLWIYPHSLAYFNELVGGPNGGPDHLLGSNCDWGQDLRYLEAIVKRQPSSKRLELQLAYHGYVDPRHLGITYSFPRHLLAIESQPRPVVPGLHAISVNYLKGSEWYTPDGSGNRLWFPRDGSADYRRLEPIGRAGYTILLYRIGGP
jgi:hypothetical protein